MQSGIAVSLICKQLSQNPWSVSTNCTALCIVSTGATPAAHQHISNAGICAQFVQVVKWMDRSMQKAKRPDGSWAPWGGQQQGGYGAPGVLHLE